MDKKTFFLGVIGALAALSIILNVAFVFLLVKNTQLWLEKQKNGEIIDFSNMFVQSVLLSDREVDFDTRLSLETAVRNINDQEILSQWDAFTKSSTQQEATKEAKELLGLLIKKSSQ